MPLNEIRTRFDSSGVRSLSDYGSQNGIESRNPDSARKSAHGFFFFALGVSVASHDGQTVGGAIQLPRGKDWELTVT